MNSLCYLNVLYNGKKYVVYFKLLCIICMYACTYERLYVDENRRKSGPYLAFRILRALVWNMVSLCGRPHRETTTRVRIWQNYTLKKKKLGSTQGATPFFSVYTPDFQCVYFFLTCTLEFLRFVSCTVAPPISPEKLISACIIEEEITVYIAQGNIIIRIEATCIPRKEQ